MSIDCKIAWRNIWRNPRRSLLTMAAIAFACLLLVFMLSWQLGSYDTMIDSSLKIHTGHLQIQGKGYNEKKDIRTIVADPDTLMTLLDTMPSVAAYTSRARAFSLVSSLNRTYGIMITGINPEKEATVSTIKTLIRQGSYLNADDTNQALIGSIMAENLKVHPGDDLVILGQGFDGSVAASVIRVKGIFRSGQDDFDRSCLYIPLAYFQEVFSMNAAVHEIVVMGTTLDNIHRIKQTISSYLANTGKTDLAVLDWMDLLPGLIESIQLDLYSGLIFYVILIIVVAFSILNTFLMAIFERTREFGVLLAMGTSHPRLIRLLLLESGGITLIGITTGIIAGALVTWYFQIHGIVISGTSDLLRQFGMPDRIFPKLTLLSLSIGPALVFIITFVTALYPALKVRKLNPVQALASS